MKTLQYIDRVSGEEKQEQVYGDFFIQLLYGKGPLSRLFSTLLLPLITRCPILSKLYGMLQKTRLSRRKIAPFIRRFAIDTTDFQDPVSSFTTFNDFFIRRLKAASRPIDTDPHVAVLPADARYFVFPHMGNADGFFVKGKKFSLATLLQNSSLADQFTHGAMVIARLAPVDYHRFHFPCDGFVHPSSPIPGFLHSVNPLALVRHAEILSQNRRMVTQIDSPQFGTFLFIEVGAVCVGTIHQTFTPNRLQYKGSEKGYFSFGGSCVILLFQPGVIKLDADLVAASARGLEVLGKMGQSLGHSLK